MLFEDNARNRLRGIGIVVVLTFCMATTDACAKWLVRSIPVGEIVWLRFLFHAISSGIFLAPTYGRELFRVRSLRLQLLRAAMLGVMTVVNFTALKYLQLAELGAIQFSAPIFIALISGFVLGEHLGARRWLAILAGFGGVILIIRPGTQGFHPIMILSLANAAVSATFNLLTRRLAATESPAATQLMSALGAAVLFTPVALVQWEFPKDAVTWGVLVSSGVFGGLGHYLLAKAHRYASAAVLAPYLYLQMVYMAIWGWVLFDQLPDLAVVVGAITVVGSGLFMLYREVR